MTSENEAPINQTNITTGGGDYAGRDIDKRRADVFVAGDAHGTVIGQQHNYYSAPTTPLDRQQQRNRIAMLAKVKTIWIDGLRSTSRRCTMRQTRERDDHRRQHQGRRRPDRRRQSARRQGDGR